MKKLILGLFITFSITSFAQGENTWLKKSDFSGLKRERAVAFTAGGYGFVGTGIDTAEVVHKDIWRFDASNDTWSQVADLPGSERRNAVGFSLNDKGYIATGFNKVTSSEVGALKLSDMWEYDATANTWTQKASFPGNGGQGVYFATVFTIENIAYLCGGKQGPNNYSSTLYSYDPVTDQWLLGPNFPGGVRYQLSSFSILDKGYVGLGTDQDMYRSDWWEYKPSTNSWAQKSNLPSSQRANATTFTIGTRGFVCMGTNGGALGDLWEYSQGSDSWSVRAPYGGSARKGAIAMVINNKAYVGTGKGTSGKKASMHVYEPFNVVGIDELENNLSIYPNPVNNVININAKVPVEELVLTNAYGQIVISESFSSFLDVSHLASGVYYLTGKSNGNLNGTKKIIIQ